MGAFIAAIIIVITTYVRMYVRTTIISSIAHNFNVQYVPGEDAIGAWRPPRCSSWPYEMLPGSSRLLWLVPRCGTCAAIGGASLSARETISKPAVIAFSAAMQRRTWYTAIACTYVC